MVWQIINIIEKESSVEDIYSQIQELDPIQKIRQWEGRFSTNNGFDLYYRIYENPNANAKNTLVALHGTTSNGGTFKDTIPELMEIANYKYIITPDIPGNGQSTTRDNASVEDFAEAIKELVEKLPEEKVIYAHSGHAAIGIELYKQMSESQGLILAGPTYSANQTFLGPFGKPILEFLKKLPDKMGLAGGIKNIYAKFFAHKHEKELQTKRKITMSNKALYQDVITAEEYFKNNAPFFEGGENVAILRFERDPLSKLSVEDLKEIHGDVWIIDTGYKGHHLQKGNPRRLAEYHKEILSYFKTRNRGQPQ